MVQEDEIATDHPIETVLLNEGNVIPSLGNENSTKSCIWYLDIGASNHMSGCLDLFMALYTKYQER